MWPFCRMQKQKRDSIITSGVSNPLLMKMCEYLVVFSRNNKEREFRRELLLFNFIGELGLSPGFLDFPRDLSGERHSLEHTAQG